MKNINIISCIFRKILLIRIEVTNNGVERKELATVYFRKGKVDIREFQKFESKTLSKWKNTPVLLWVTGDLVISKIYTQNDLALKRIIDNPELLWNIEIKNEQEQILSFLRKDKLSDFLQTAEKNHLFLIDTWIYGIENSYDIVPRLEQLYKEGFKSSALLKGANPKNQIANILFRRLFLPVLLMFFALLLGNFFLYSHYTKQYQQKQSFILQNRKDNRINSAEQQKKNQLIAAYTQIPDRSFALLADRIASYVPANLHLTSLDMFPIAKNANRKEKKGLSIEYNTIRLKGLVETPGAITLLSQFIESDTLFKKVRIVRLDRLKNSDIFEFELEITL